jgi:hypothetical protein
MRRIARNKGVNDNSDARTGRTVRNKTKTILDVSDPAMLDILESCIKLVKESSSICLNSTTLSQGTLKSRKR